MPASRPELDIEVRQELLDRFLREYEKERRAGKTVGAVFDKLEKHIEQDDERFGGLMRELGEARQDIAREEGRLNGVVDTGRFTIPVGGAPVQVNVEAPKTSKRPSGPPWAAKLLEKVVEKPLLIVLTGLLTLLGHALLKLLK